DGVAFNVMKPGASLTVSSPTQIPGWGKVFAGQFKLVLAGGNAYDLQPRLGSVFQRNGMDTPAYVTELAGHLMAVPATITGNVLNIALPAFSLADGATAALSGAQFHGEITSDGVVTMNSTVKTSLTRYDHASILRDSSVTVTVSDKDGITMNGWVRGTLQW